jgi:hypothetical protein
MTKYDAFGTILKMGNGAFQTETATIVGTVSQSGNATFTITCTGMGNSPKAISVPVLNLDTAAQVAAKAAIVLNADADVSAMFYAASAGDYVILIRKIAAADIANLNIAFTNGTCLGLTPNATSANTVVGGAAEAFTTVGQVTNIGGLSLSLDTEDVTTHDQATAWEEVVATILRSGELTVDLVYDPASLTVGTGSGLLFKMEYRILSNFKMIFPDAAGTEWDFAAYVNSFEPSGDVKGALTATSKLKVTGAPTLA